MISGILTGKIDGGFIGFRPPYTVCNAHPNFLVASEAGTFSIAAIHAFLDSSSQELPVFVSGSP